MTDYRYVIIGGGMAGYAALQAIRKKDNEAAIAMFTAEPHPPYKRPPLSKGLWKDESVEDVWYVVPDQVDLRTGRTIVRLDAEAKRVTDDQGAEFGYERLLLATGGTPRRLAHDADGVIYFRDMRDYERLSGFAEEKRDFVVVGGGFIGTEIAAALAMHDCRVTMIVPEDGLGGMVYPQDLSLHLVEYFTEHGVSVRTRESVRAVDARDDAFVVRTGGDEEIAASAVVVGIGLEPNVDLALQAGIDVDNGILVDAHLRTSNPDIYAAGDVARFVPTALGRPMRFEHEENAVLGGDVAGTNMTGGDRKYDHLPLFYSDLFDLGYEAVGMLDNRMQTVADWKDRFREGVVYYLDGERRVRGVLLWNVWGRVDDARKLIAGGEPVSASDLQGRIAG